MYLQKWSYGCTLALSNPLLYNAFILAFRMAAITIALYFRISVTVELYVMLLLLEF